MTTEQKGIITLIRNAIGNASYPLPDGFLLENAFSIVQRHNIYTFIYIGSKKVGLLPNKELIFNSLSRISYQASLIYSANEILKAFDKQGIDYLPVKGIITCRAYPNQEMRSMSDVDILIKLEQYELIRRVMLNLGYTEGVESNHELHWHKHNITIELHKRLIPSYNTDFYAYFGDGWELASRDETGHWALSDEDYFVYVFTHFAKHYRDGGIGINHLVDLWILRDTYDVNEVEKKLNALHLKTFYENISRVLRVWFDDGASDDLTDFITNRIFESGTYGNEETHDKADSLRKTRYAHGTCRARIKYIFSVVFPPFLLMKSLYPVIKQHVILLPIFWVVRWITIIQKSPENIKKQWKKSKAISSDKNIRYQKELEYVGLDYWF